MKIHLLSDVHLESGPYQIPSSLDCDVIVAAGDIGVGNAGVEWLKTLEKPVIYVLGNHEYWTKKDAPVDMSDVLENIKDAAAGSNVHVLENESVVIDDVRFVGATLWTNLGRFNPILIEESFNMRDYSHINCKKLYEDSQFLARFKQCADRYCALRDINNIRYMRDIEQRYIETGQFHPFAGFLLHEISSQKIGEQIYCAYREEESSATFKKTVVVTHHHPSYESLRLCGLTDAELYPTGPTIRHSPSSRLHEPAAYASEMGFDNFAHLSTTPFMDAWLCGHIHQKMDYAMNGTRVICNPRGRHIKPITEVGAHAFAILGFPISQADIEKSQRRFTENPLQGDGLGFDENLIIDLSAGIMPLLQSEIALHIHELQRLHRDINKFDACIVGVEKQARKAILESITSRAEKFAQRAKVAQNLIFQHTNKNPQFVNRLAYDPTLTRDANDRAIITRQKNTIAQMKAWCHENAPRTN